MLFDFGDVLAEEGFRAGLYSIAKESGLEPQALYTAGVEAVFASGYVLGKGLEAEFWIRLRTNFGLEQDDEALTRIIHAHFVLRKDMIELVRGLRSRGVVCAIVSDQTDWLERLDARDHFFREFDRVYCSYRLGKSKRDASLFDDVVAYLGMPPEEVVFVDDDTGNIMRAESRGLKGHLL